MGLGLELLNIDSNLLTTRALFLHKVTLLLFKYLYSSTVELKDLKLQEKKLKEKCKQEDGIVSAASVWTNEILPNWETM